jgi:hypothetical protein
LQLVELLLQRLAQLEICIGVRRAKRQQGQAIRRRADDQEGF